MIVIFGADQCRSPTKEIQLARPVSNQNICINYLELHVQLVSYNFYTAVSLTKLLKRMLDKNCWLPEISSALSKNLTKYFLHVKNLQWQGIKYLFCCNLKVGDIHGILWSFFERRKPCWRYIFEQFPQWDGWSCSVRRYKSFHGQVRVCVNIWSITHMIYKHCTTWTKISKGKIGNNQHFFDIMDAGPDRFDHHSRMVTVTGIWEPRKPNLD